jgi:hypothetical protein
MSENDHPANQRKWASAVIVAGCVAALGVYMAAYYGLVKRIETMWGPEPLVEYRCGGGIAEVFFFPAHCLDKVVRPGAWGPWVPSEEDIRRSEAKQRYARRSLPDRPVAD